MTYFGKYRGQVVANIDPDGVGRVQVSVPAVLGEGAASWAMPCVPLSGDGIGICAVPKVGANVWVEFEGGDPTSPILGGGFWTAGEIPGDGLPTTTVIKTDSVSITIDDRPGGGLTIEVGPPAVPAPMTLAMTPAGIEISTGASTFVVDAASVSVNGHTLERGDDTLSSI